MDKVADYVMQRLNNRGHCLIVVAEGAGQNLMEGPVSYDASGNKKLGDIGVYLRDHMGSFLKKRGVTDFSIKYIDPSYMIRSKFFFCFYFDW
jgi:6-phosphofructokinase 1